MMLVNGEGILKASSEANTISQDETDESQMPFVNEALEIIDCGKAINQTVSAFKDKLQELVSDFDKLENQTQTLNRRLDLFKQNAEHLVKFLSKTPGFTPQKTPIASKSIVNNHISASSPHFDVNSDQSVQEPISMLDDYSKTPKTVLKGRLDKTPYADDTNFDMHLELNETTIYQETSTKINKFTIVIKKILFNKNIILKIRLESTIMLQARDQHSMLF
jgi:hypothetical protein